MVLEFSAKVGPSGRARRRSSTPARRVAPKRRAKTGLISARRLRGLAIAEPCELVEGKIVYVSPSYRWVHGSVIARILAALIPFVVERRLGEVTSAEAGYQVRSRPDTVRAPGITFMSWARVRQGRARGGPFSKVAPELVVEVLSNDNRTRAGRADMRTKITDFLALGMLLFWVVDPKSRTVAVHLPGTAKPSVLSGDDLLEGGAALPGFRTPVRRFFEDAPRP